MATRDERTPATELLLRRADTGHFVLIEPRSQTTVVDEELERAYARILEVLAHADEQTSAATPPASSFEFRGRVRLWAVIIAVGLPLLWLLAIERRVSELQRRPPPAASAAPTVNQGIAAPAPTHSPLASPPAPSGKEAPKLVNAAAKRDTDATESASAADSDAAATGED